MKGSRSQKNKTSARQRVQSNVSKRSIVSTSSSLSKLGALRSPSVSSKTSRFSITPSMSTLSPSSTTTSTAVNTSPITNSNRGVFGTVAKKIAGRFLIQYGNPSYLDRQKERDQFLPKEAVEHAQLPMRAARGHPEFDFDTAYYKRVNLIPPSYSPTFAEDALVLQQEKPIYVTTPNHVPHSFVFYQEEYPERQSHVMKHTGVATLTGRQPINDKEWTLMGLDSDYHYFHD